MKVFNSIIIAIGGLCSIGILWCIANILFLGPGTGPDDILSAVDLNLSKYKIENKYDNLDRGASRFDNYTYEISFSSSEANELVKQMQKGNWERSDDMYIKFVDVDADLTYSAFVNPESCNATLEVLIDEDYNLLYVIYAIFIVLGALFLAGICGVVQLITYFLKRNK